MIGNEYLRRISLPSTTSTFPSPHAKPPDATGICHFVGMHAIINAADYIIDAFDYKNDDCDCIIDAFDYTTFPINRLFMCWDAEEYERLETIRNI